MNKQRKKKQIKNIKRLILNFIIVIFITIIGYYFTKNGENLFRIEENNQVSNIKQQNISSFDISNIPEYKNVPYVVLNDNKPEFKERDMKAEAFEKYSKLDELGRCGIAYACVGIETMPTGKRGDISKIKPTGWQTVKYDIIVGKYLYNRCHLIGYQLTAENDNEKNLITGTRYMNVEGMLPFENKVADYIDNTENHVLYRVTPIFKENDLVARGVKMEAKSVEDDGKGVCFNVYVYNVQPNITINYANGKSTLTK